MSNLTEKQKHDIKKRKENYPYFSMIKEYLTGNKIHEIHRTLIFCKNLQIMINFNKLFGIYRL